MSKKPEIVLNEMRVSNNGQPLEGWVPEASV
jgi:hypothetical protein